MNVYVMEGESGEQVEVGAELERVCVTSPAGCFMQG